MRRGWSALRLRVSERALAHGRHVAVGAVAAGLATGAVGLPVTAVTALLAAAACRLVPLVASRSAAVAIGAVVLVAGAGGYVRVGSLGHTSLGSSFHRAVAGDATLLTAPRTESYGGQRALIQWRGEPVLLRLPRWRHQSELAVGDVVRVEGTVVPPDRTSSLLGAHAMFRATLVAATGRRRGGPAGVVDGIRRGAQAGFAKGLPPTGAALMSGMVLGQDEALPPDVRDAFQTSGLSHLTAASGQNIMLLVALALGVSIVIGIGLRARWILAAGMILLYVPLAGSGPSIQRAAIAGLATSGAALSGRPASRWYAVLLGLAGTLALDPRAVRAIGWQLSFVSVLGIALLAEPLDERLRDQRVPPPLAAAVAMTVAATLSTAPVLVAHFGRLSLAALPANVLAAPAVPVVMWMGMVSAAVAQCWPSAGAALAGLAALPLAFILWVARTGASLPAAQVAAPLAAVGLVTGCAAIWIRHRARSIPGLGRRRAAVLAPAALVVILVAAQQRWLRPAARPLAPDELRITALDIGQGDATLLQVPGHAVLVDAGPVGAPLVPELRQEGVRHLDALVLTHPQADHDGGAPAVLDQLPVSLMLDGRGGDRSATSLAVDPALRPHRTRVVAAEAGQELHAGALTLRVLWPPPGPAVPGTDPNDRAVVAIASAYGSRALMTADAESPVLAPLDLPAVDVLKVSHHGSADPGLPALLERLRPRVALVEVGRHNPYGHPAPQTMHELDAAVPAVARTDQDGTVSVDLVHGVVRDLVHG